MGTTLGLGQGPVSSVFELKDGTQVHLTHPRKGGLGYMPWPGAWALSRYIDDNASELGLERHRAIELGSGACGLVGRVAGHLCRSVLLTDTREVVPELCEAVRMAPASNLDVRELNWIGIWTTVALYKPGEFDLILMSDVVYFDALFKPLLNTLLALCDETTTVLWGNGDTYPDYKHPPIGKFLRMAAGFFNIEVLQEYRQEEVGAPTACVASGGRVSIFRMTLRNVAKARDELDQAVHFCEFGSCLKKLGL